MLITEVVGSVIGDGYDSGWIKVIFATTKHNVFGQRWLVYGSWFLGYNVTLKGKNIN